MYVRTFYMFRPSARGNKTRGAHFKNCVLDYSTTKRIKKNMYRENGMTEIKSKVV